MNNRHKTLLRLKQSHSYRIAEVVYKIKCAISESIQNTHYDWSKGKIPDTLKKEWTEKIYSLVPRQERIKLTINIVDKGDNHA